jgi:hypothetical protein
MDAHGGRVPLAPRKTTTTLSNRPATSATMRGTAQTSQSLSAGREATEAMFSRLCDRMQVNGFAWPTPDGDTWTDDNDAVPAGYTYLAQLVAHDLVQNSAQLPLISDFPGVLQRDYRTQRLVLDTLYGGGPGTEPAPYGVDTADSGERCLFRLGRVRDREPINSDFATGPNANPTEPTLLDQQPARDIPRMRCPHMTDAAKRLTSPDALVADARNDQHLLVSQLTALFLELHNIIFRKVRALQVAPSSQLAADLNLPQRADFDETAHFVMAQNDLAFLHARKLLAFVYRRVVMQDLIRRLLDPGVYDGYATGRLRPKSHGAQVPAEFSHAAFRFGHVMARFSYKLNDHLERNASIKDVLDRSSARESRLVPLARDWLIDWSHFFDLGDGKSINASRRIQPYSAMGSLATDDVVINEKGRNGGLFYRDLLRGYEANVASVQSLINALPPEEVARSQLLKDIGYRETRIGEWLRHSPGVKFTPEERVALSKSPPLIFFVLFEAAMTQQGRRLGILGSSIIADVVFAAFNNNRAVIEADPAVSSLATQVFGQSIPKDMAALITFSKANGGLADVSTTPPSA